MTVCSACATVYEEQLERCPICEDERQYVPAEGQKWIAWARRFDCPVWLHEADREWIQRRDDRIELWSGETKELGGGLTLIRLGGHFAGGTVLHWAEGGALLSGDIVQVLPGGRWVSFMHSYPMLIPLPAREVERIAAALDRWDYDRIIGAWWGRVVKTDGKAVVRRSAVRYVRALR